MSNPAFPVHTPESAPVASKPVLEAVGKKYGFVPNLMGVLASAPSAVEAYAAIGALFAQTSLPLAAREVVLLTVARANECSYCVAAHSTTATMADVPVDVIAAVREERPIADAKLEAVRVLTRAIVATRGRVEQRDLDQFLAAGYRPAHVLEVIVGVTLKTLSTYTNHLADTPVDAVFAPHRWDRSPR